MRIIQYFKNRKKIKKFETNWYELVDYAIDNEILSNNSLYEITNTSIINIKGHTITGFETNIILTDLYSTKKLRTNEFKTLVEDIFGCEFILDSDPLDYIKDCINARFVFY